MTTYVESIFEFKKNAGTSAHRLYESTDVPEQPTKENLQAYMQLAFSNTYDSVTPSTDNMLQVKFKNTMSPFSIKVDMASSAANGELKPKTLFTANVFVFENDKTLHEKPVSLAHAVSALKKYSSNPKELQKQILIIASSTTKLPPEKIVELGKTSV